MTLEKRIVLFSKLGHFLSQNLESGHLDSLIYTAQSKNPWFTIDNIKLSLRAIISNFLSIDKLNGFIDLYPKSHFEPSKALNVGIVAAGNLPLVSFQDILQVLLAGHKVVLKTSSQDEVLIQFLRKNLIEMEPMMEKFFEISERLNHVDAIIATGSGNTSRYFEYYFANKPNIIRKNRNSVAILDGKESKNQISELAGDIFSYFGLGCRNVSMLWVPFEYDFNTFFEAIEYWSSILLHSKYKNNYDYMKSIYLVNREPHFDNGFLLLKENPALASPISVLHFQYYNSQEQLKNWINQNQEQIQVVLSNNKTLSSYGLGMSQSPELSDYADGVDVMRFLHEATS